MKPKRKNIFNGKILLLVGAFAMCVFNKQGNKLKGYSHIHIYLATYERLSQRTTVIQQK